MTRILGLALAASLAASCAGRTEVTQVQVENQVLAERLEQYLVIRREAVDAAGRLPVSQDPEVIVDATATLADEIRTRRQDAREGEILGPPVAEQIRSDLRARLSRRDGDRILARLLNVQPEEFEPVVNARHPGDQARSTMPAEVLQALPRIPQELSFRFVGRDLVLLDRTPGVVLDVLRDALPAGAGD